MAKKTIVTMAAAVLCMASGLRADDTSLKAELADLKAKVAALEGREMAPAAGGDAESLTSLKKKGNIRIGGGVKIPIMVTTRDEDPTNVNGEDDQISSTQFRGEADLTFDIQASKNNNLIIKLDLEDFWDETVSQDDLLEECYYTFKNVLGSGFSFAFGKKELAFGQDKSVGAILDPFVHGAAVLFAANEESNTTNTEYTNDNLHEKVGSQSWIGEIDNVFVIETSYSYKELVKAYFSVFQSRSTTGNGGLTRGMHEDRSDDTLLFQSVAFKLECKPIENLTLQTSFVNEHNDSKGDDALNTTGKYAEADRQALSVAFDWKLKSVPLGFFGEYIHGWNYSFDDRAYNDVAQLGMNWFVTKNITYSLMGEYANVNYDKGDIANNAYYDQDYWNLHTAIGYQFDSGVTLTMEYAHQWFDGDRKNAKNVNADADCVAFTVSWKF